MFLIYAFFILFTTFFERSILLFNRLEAIEETLSKLKQKRQGLPTWRKELNMPAVKKRGDKKNALEVLSMLPADKYQGLIF